MIDETIFASLRKNLSSTQRVAVFLPPQPKTDQTAAALSWMLSLKKLGKEVGVFCPSEMKVAMGDLVGVDLIKKEMGGRNLIISFDYLEDSIEKVSYHIENQKFNLVVQPKVGFPPLDANKVSYEYAGGAADWLFTFGVKSPADLKSLSSNLKSLFEKKETVQIDIDSRVNQFGQTKIVLPQAASFSEIVAELLAQLSLPIDQDIAANLLSGIKKATQNFSSSRVVAETFEAAAFCLRAGAGREARGPSTGKFISSASPLKPMPQQISQQKKPGQDWMEPKVYQGSTKI